MYRRLGGRIPDLGQIICKMRPLIPLRNVCESTLLTVRAYANWYRFPEMAPHLLLPGIRSSRIWKIDKPRKNVRSEIPELSSKQNSSRARDDRILSWLMCLLLCTLPSGSVWYVCVLPKLDLSFPVI